MFWAHEPNRPVASPNSRSTPATPSPAKCSRKRLKGRRVACSWRPCARSRPTIAERCRRVVCRSVAPLPSKADARASPLLLPRARLRPPLLCCRGRHGHGCHCRRARFELPLLLAQAAAKPLLTAAGQARTPARPRLSIATSRPSPRTLALVFGRRCAALPAPLPAATAAMPLLAPAGQAKAIASHGRASRPLFFSVLSGHRRRPMQPRASPTPQRPLSLACAV